MKYKESDYRDKFIYFCSLNFDEFIRIGDPKSDINSSFGVNLKAVPGEYDVLFYPDEQNGFLRMIKIEKKKSQKPNQFFSRRIIGIPSESGHLSVCNMAAWGNEKMINAEIQEYDPDLINFLEFRENPFLYLCKQKTKMQNPPIGKFHNGIACAPGFKGNLFKIYLHKKQGIKTTQYDKIVVDFRRDKIIYKDELN